MISRKVPPMSAGDTLKWWTFADDPRSLEEIAEVLGYAPEVFTSILEGTFPFTISLAVQIEKEFGVSADVLVRVELNYQRYMSEHRPLIPKHLEEYDYANSAKDVRCRR